MYQVGDFLTLHGAGGFEYPVSAFLEDDFKVIDFEIIDVPFFGLQNEIELQSGETETDFWDRVLNEVNLLIQASSFYVGDFSYIINNTQGGDARYFELSVINFKNVITSAWRMTVQDADSEIYEIDGNFRSSYKVPPSDPNAGAGSQNTPSTFDSQMESQQHTIY